MTAFDRFERSLPVLLDDLAITRMPDYADALLARTAATRQRPGWTFLERWIPMSALTQRFAAVPRFQLRLIVAVALLVVAAIVGTIVAGSLAPRRPAPFGPAANGQIAFLDGTNRILAGDPATGKSSVLIAEAGNSHLAYSPDGSRLAFTRSTSGGGYDLLVANADGSRETKLSPDSIGAPSFVAWAPQSDRIVVVDVIGRLFSLDASSPGAPTDLSQKFGLGSVQVGSGHNDQTAHVFRPPTGDELLFVSDAGSRLRAVQLDSGRVRTLVDRQTLGSAYASLGGAQWSPDGSQVVVAVALDYGGPSHLYLLNASGTDLRPIPGLSTDPADDQAHPLWSPNGTKIAFQHWYRSGHGPAGEDFFPIEVVDLATGLVHEIGPTLINGATWTWSPDGLSILELPANPPGDGHMLIINADTGFETQTPWIVNDLNWQRIASR